MQNYFKIIKKKPIEYKLFTLELTLALIFTQTLSK